MSAPRGFGGSSVAQMIAREMRHAGQAKHADDVRCTKCTWSGRRKGLSRGCPKCRQPIRREWE